MRAPVVLWYSVLAIFVALLLVSVTLPVPRRLWAFGLTAAKYGWLWLLDAIGLRKLWLKARGKRSCSACSARTWARPSSSSARSSRRRAACSPTAT
jgi:hypothetical protein